jgi:tRNA-dihydrouridine synthase B
MDFGRKKLFLAPMAGITDTVFRTLCRQCGADVVMSEMISAEGIFRSSKKTRALINFSEQERPIGIQIFGADPAHIAFTAAYIEENCHPDFIDLNSGCPALKVVKKNGGSALLRDPALFGKILSAMVKAVSVPVTVKIRSGWFQNEFVDVEFARIAQESGASAIIVHPRSKTMAFSGHSSWERIAAVKKAVTIPVIGNGDICNGNDAKTMFEQTGCDSIMIGRAAFGNPWIFSEITSFINNKPTFKPPDKYALIMEHIRRFTKINGERRATGELKKHVAWYIKGHPQAGSMRNEVFRCTNINELEKIVAMVFQNSGETNGKQ